jgi:hypothetical protein
MVAARLALPSDPKIVITGLVDIEWCWICAVKVFISFAPWPDHPVDGMN